MSAELSQDDFLRWVHQSPGKSTPDPAARVQSNHECWSCRTDMPDCLMGWHAGNAHCCIHCEHGYQVSQRGYSYASARAEGWSEDQARDLAAQPGDGA